MGEQPGSFRGARLLRVGRARDANVPRETLQESLALGFEPCNNLYMTTTNRNELGASQGGTLIHITTIGGAIAQVTPEQAVALLYFNRYTRGDAEWLVARALSGAPAHFYPMGGGQ